jgi:hypothetical protein
LTPEDQYQIYKQKRAARIAEQKAIQDELDQQKAILAVAWAELRKPKTVTTRQPHVCSGCGQSIPAGSCVVKRTPFENVSSRGYTIQPLTKYYCNVCRPIKEVEKQ